MNTDVCEHYGQSICSYFWDKLMRNLTLLHEILVRMKTANCQTSFHKTFYYDKFVLHMSRMLAACAFKNISNSKVWFYSCVDRLSNTPFQQAKNIWPTTRKIHTLGFEQPTTSFANNKTKLQKLQNSEIKKQ